MKSLTEIQAEMKPWVLHNFGDRPAWQPLLGAVEEVGELSHAFLKKSQGIRVNEDHDEAMKDAVADTVIYLMDFCNVQGYSLHQLVHETWEKVGKRDWKKNAATGAQ